MSSSSTFTARSALSTASTSFCLSASETSGSDWPLLWSCLRIAGLSAALSTSSTIFSTSIWPVTFRVAEPPMLSPSLTFGSWSQADGSMPRSLNDCGPLLVCWACWRTNCS